MSLSSSSMPQTPVSTLDLERQIAVYEQDMTLAEAQKLVDAHHSRLHAYNRVKDAAQVRIETISTHETLLGKVSLFGLQAFSRRHINEYATVHKIPVKQVYDEFGITSEQ